LTDHHAIIPLAPLPQRASADEKTIYDLVMKRFAAAFHADCEYEQTNIVTQVETEAFRTQGKRILKPGWRTVYGMEIEKKAGSEDDTENENLPPLEKDNPAKVIDTKIDHKETLPPPEYTEALLLRDMTNPARYVAENELKQIYRGDIGLGTQSTRAQIIETLLMRKYVQRQKRYLIALDKGCLLIDTLRGFEKAKILTSPEETARWEMQLNRIAQGEESGQTFLNNIKTFIHEIVDEFKSGNIAPETSVQSSPSPMQDLQLSTVNAPDAAVILSRGKKDLDVPGGEKKTVDAALSSGKPLPVKKFPKVPSHNFSKKEPPKPFQVLLPKREKIFRPPEN
jgi:DNA topoisomerase III